MKGARRINDAWTTAAGSHEEPCPATFSGFQCLKGRGHKTEHTARHTEIHTFGDGSKEITIRAWHWPVSVTTATVEGVERTAKKAGRR